MIKEIEELGYSGTGRKYGVSDNAIRKWKKFYENHEKWYIVEYTNWQVVTLWM